MHTRFIFLWVCVLGLLIRHSVATTVSPTPSLRAEPLVNATGTHAFTDANGDVWHVLDGNHTTEQAPAKPVETPTKNASDPHPAQVNLSEQVNQPSSSKSTTITAHHSSPLTGAMFVGAVGILCVGVAATIAQRKKRTKGDNAQDH